MGEDAVSAQSAPPLTRAERIARLAKLAAAGVFPASTLVRADRMVKRPGSKQRDRGVPQSVVELVLGRDHWQCCVCGGELHGQRGFDWSLHHRLRRSQGIDHSPSNTVSVCGHGTVGCHSDIHANPAKARETGWLLRSTDDPLKVVMAHAVHGWVLLDNYGSWTSVNGEEGRHAGKGA
jgi:hypothetical protein